VDYDDVDGFDGSVEALHDTLGATSTMVSGFDGELRRMRETFGALGKDAATLELGLSRGLRSAFDGVVFGGMKMSDALETVANSMIRSTYNAAMKPVTQHFGGLLAGGVSQLAGALLPFADGAPFSQGRVMPFAKGGVVSSPTHFPMRGATGLMGEAGPEAIMPLVRGSDGSLGVRSAGGGSQSIVMNISTPDAASFQRSQTQIAAQMQRMLSRGQRNR